MGGDDVGAVLAPVLKYGTPIGLVSDRFAGESGKRGSLARLASGRFLFHGADPETVRKPPLTKSEAARKQATERARVARLRAQAGYSGTDAINTPIRPMVGGSGGTVG